jgi:hypothetical protein
MHRVLNVAGSGSLERSVKRKQDDGANNSHSTNSCDKWLKKYNSLSDADSGVDKMSSDNVADADTQSAEHLPRKWTAKGMKMQHMKAMLITVMIKCLMTILLVLTVNQLNIAPAKWTAKGWKCNT